MLRMLIGRYIQQPTGYKAFVPEPFPPKGLVLSDNVLSDLEKATSSLGRLDGLAEMLPDLDFFIFMYVRKEATLSSQVEGTKATMVDALRAEVDLKQGLPDDVDDILRYIEALNLGMARLTELPLSIRLIREAHERLLSPGSRTESHAYPGQLRTTQNWVGGATPDRARFVPPPPDQVPEALSQIERFIHLADAMPNLIRAGLAHAQFETVHPFVDGNGRTGRLLVTFMLCEKNLIRRPILYLSEFFKRHREIYFDRLHDYHDKGNVNEWLEFFLSGVQSVAEEGAETIRRINDLWNRDIPRVAGFGKNQETALKVIHHLFKSPIVTVRRIQEITGLARNNANRLVDKFVDAGILVQMDETVEYGRTFVYRDYLAIFDSP